MTSIHHRWKVCKSEEVENEDRQKNPICFLFFLLNMTGRFYFFLLLTAGKCQLFWEVESESCLQNARQTHLEVEPHLSHTWLGSFKLEPNEFQLKGREGEWMEELLSLTRKMIVWWYELWYFARKGKHCIPYMKHIYGIFHYL